MIKNNVKKRTIKILKIDEKMVQKNYFFGKNGA